MVLLDSRCLKDSNGISFVIFGLAEDFILILQDQDKFCYLNFNFEITLDWEIDWVATWLFLIGGTGSAG
jgi:hypothetical protein